MVLGLYLMFLRNLNFCIFGVDVMLRLGNGKRLNSFGINYVSVPFPFLLGPNVIQSSHLKGEKLTSLKSLSTDCV